MLKYNTIADSLVTVSNAEVQKYYDEHKNSYTQQPHRSISYVVFEVNPTDDDMLAIEKEVRAVGEEFAAAYSRLTPRMMTCLLSRRRYVP